MVNPSALTHLAEVDWDFLSEYTNPIPNLHWYPAAFPAMIPSTLIQALSSPGGLVYDPFSGVGTTGREALLLGRRAVLHDNNPVGLLTAYVSSSLAIAALQCPETLPALLSDVRRIFSGSVRIPKSEPLFNLTSASADDLDRLLGGAILPDPALAVDTYINKPQPEWECLAEWIAPKTLKRIQGLWRAIAATDASAISRLLAAVILSDRLRAASSQNRSWGHVADNVKPKSMVERDLPAALNRSLTRLERALAVLPSQPSTSSLESPVAMVLPVNWSDENAETPCSSEVELLLTSPPYPDAIDYNRAQRLSLYLLGHSPEEVNQLAASEIGARWKRSRVRSRQDWEGLVERTLQRQLHLISPRGYLALVLPDKNGDRSTSLVQIGDYLANCGWSLVYEAERSIRQDRTRHSWTSIKREVVQVFSRQGR